MKRSTEKTKPITEQIKETSKKPVSKKETVYSNKLSTGATLLDLIVGGGYPFGKIVNIVGDKSSGKTYLALETIATAKKIYGKKLKWFFDNAEAGFSFDTDAMYGFEVVPKNAHRSITVEDFASNLNIELGKLKKGEKLIYVLDSLDGLTSDTELKREDERQKAYEDGKTLEKGSYAMDRQKFMSQFFRLRCAEIEDKECLLIVISQVRSNIGVTFGNKYTRTGGKALDFYANIILWLAEAAKLKKKERAIGITIKARTEKAKIKTPFRSGFIELIFDYGIDDVVTNINYLYDLKDKKGKDKSKTKLKWKTKEYTKPALIKHIEQNDLEKELAEKVKEKWDEIEDSISSKGRKAKWST